VVPPLGVHEQLRTPVAPERAGEGQGQAGHGVLQPPAADVTDDGLAAGRASPMDVNPAGITHDVPVLALANKHMTNERSDSPLRAAARPQVHTHAI
jgi:hypothetical protein